MLRNHLQLATETASHITPLSPWRGVGGEAFLGEGLGVRPVGGTRLFWREAGGEVFYFITL